MSHMVDKVDVVWVDGAIADPGDFEANGGAPAGREDARAQRLTRALQRNHPPCGVESWGRPTHRCGTADREPGLVARGLVVDIPLAPLPRRTVRPEDHGVYIPMAE
jgi:hypothetical protein